MNKFFIFFLSVLFISTGCKTLNSDKVQKTKDTLAETRIELSKNNEEKLTTISTLAAGTDYSLHQVTNPPTQVKTAIDLNSKVINIAGNPNLDELKKIKDIVDLLNSEIESQKHKGEKLLREKDQQIIDLQVERKEIENVYETQIKGLENQATQIAKKADKLQVVVDEVNSYFGLGGIAYGVKRFVSTAVIGILIFLIIFMALRFFAATNPIAGAIFSVIEHIAGFFINLIKGIAPKALEFSNHIELPIFDRYKNTLDSMVDTIEYLKSVQKKSEKLYTFDELLTELDKNLNDSDKKLISELKAINKYGK